MTTPHGTDHPHHEPGTWPSATTTPTATNPGVAGSDPNAEQSDETEGHAGHGGHGGHGLMMLVCCIPMILLAVGLVATGFAGSGAIVGALLCTAMMAVMMLAMPGSHAHR
jgi:hypothetical protein